MAEIIRTSVPIMPATHATLKGKVLQWMGSESVKVVEVPRPIITDPRDAIVRITTTTICGSDLHLYHNAMGRGMEKGDILGHEFMGLVEDVGSEVTNLKIGDRVVVAAVIADGTCDFCKRGQFSLCETTNPSKEMEDLYGHRTAGLFGYSHLTGGYPGGQAEFARVPFADVNCLKIPPSLTDEQALFLSDIVCTAWHGCELGEVSEGKTVAVWGCGPVGLLTLMWAKFRGAARIIAIDCIPYRLEVARSKLGAEVINFAEENPLRVLRDIAPGGPDVCIDCAGFRFPKSLAHKFMRALHIETDTPEVVSECIIACKKGGHIALIGDYFGTANNFPIGAMMEKSITVRGGQVFVQKYWTKLLEYIERGDVDPRFVITHTMPLEKAEEAYRMFDSKEDNSIKILLKPTPRA